jgi:hypothetical protein
VDTTGIVVSVGTTGTDSELNVFGVIKTPTSLRLGVAGTTNDIAITKTGANAIKIDSFPTTGTANAVTIGSSGTSNSLTIYGSIILSSGSYVQAETFQTGGGAAMVINPGGALSLFAGSASGWKVDTGSAKALYPSVDNTFDIGINGTNDVRAIYLQTDIYKAGSAYTNPDFVFEHHFTGRVSEKNKQGAKKYKGRKSLDAVRDHVRQNHRFETIPDKQTGMFERGDIALELLEEAYLHMFDLHDRIKVLEAR